MPSLHVGWACSSRPPCDQSQPLALALARPPGLTLLVVVATANHCWLDGVVAVAILIAVAVLADDRVRRWYVARRPTRRSVETTPPVPQPEPVASLP